MGIQLDWQIESERKRRRAVEDPTTKQRRRQQRHQLMAAIVVLAMVVCGVVGGLWWRLRSVDNSYRQDLLDTVDAEVRALKIGDLDNFMAIRRSGHQPWLDLQRSVFDEYQQMKDAGRVALTGEVLDVEMDLDESRARVVVEEVIDGVPFQVAWFYWYYADQEQSGWRRVPPDIAFWGDEQTLERDNVQVQYHELDERFAEALSTRLGEWWAVSCHWLSCPVPLPPLTISVEPRSPAEPDWDLNDNWHLILTSPMYLDRVRRDMTLEPSLERRLAQMVAARVTTYAKSPNYPFEPLFYSDAAWLFQEYQTWLAGRFTPYVEGSAFLEGVAANIGEDATGMMLRLMSADSMIGPVLGSVTDLGVMTPSLDWSSFFQWRLTLEESILRRDNISEDQVLPLHNSLYDEGDGQAMVKAAEQRQQYFDGRPSPVVREVSLSVDEEGRLVATVNLEGAVAVFRWMDLTWKRVA